MKKDIYQTENATKQKILFCAASLFARKGFTETSIRELAETVGLKGASIYNHFPSKNAILERLLKDFQEILWGNHDDPSLLLHLRENPTTEGIMALMMLTFPEGEQDYYMNILSVIMQEQHRNPVFGRYVSETFFSNESHVKMIFDVLKELNVIRQDADPDFWMKIASSLPYAFANRAMLGIGDISPGFSGKSMPDILRELFDLMLKTCGVEREENGRPD